MTGPRPSELGNAHFGSRGCFPRLLRCGLLRAGNDSALGPQFKNFCEIGSKLVADSSRRLVSIARSARQRPATRFPSFALSQRVGPLDQPISHSDRRLLQPPPVSSVLHALLSTLKVDAVGQRLKILRDASRNCFFVAIEQFAGPRHRFVHVAKIAAIWR